MTHGILTDSLVRDLPRQEILARGLPFRWWGEHQRELVCHSSIAGLLQVGLKSLTDGASVPKLAWSLLPSNDPDVLYPAYFHDPLYALRGELPHITLSRQDCDGVMEELMQLIGAPLWKRRVVYRALRVGGWAAWNQQDGREAKLETLQ